MGGSNVPSPAESLSAGHPDDRRGKEGSGNRPRRPLVYSCSGCSNVAQAANRLAVRLDREKLAEMSCIAGVGAGVPSLVRVARSGRPMLVIDGCPLACCRQALHNCSVQPTVYLDLSGLGLKKRQGEDLSDEQMETLWRDAVLPALAETKVA